MSSGESEQYDLIIVGGGMVGISLALLLRAQACHWKILLVEAQAYPEGGAVGYRPSFDARSTALSWSSRKIFDQIGLWAELEQRVSPISQVHVSDRGHVGLSRILAEEAGVEALGYVTENRWLGEVLLRALRKSAVELRAPAQVDAVRIVRDGAQVTLAGGEQLRGRLLVVADGAGSATAGQLGIHYSSQSYGQTAIIANIALSQPHQGIAYERFTDWGPMAMLPLPDCEDCPRSALVWTLPQDKASSLMASNESEFLLTLQDRFGFRLGKLVSVGQRFSYPLSLTLATEQVRRHLVVLGNAAHSLHPVAGQGFNLSLRDAAGLAEVLGEARREEDFAGLDALERFQANQAADQRNTTLFSDSLPRLFGLDTKVVQLARNSGLVAMDLLAPLRNRFARFGMGLAAREARHG